VAHRREEAELGFGGGVAAFFRFAQQPLHFAVLGNVGDRAEQHIGLI